MNARSRWFFSLALMMVLAALPLAAQSLTPSPSSVTFSSPAGSTSVQQQVVTVTVTGGGAGTVLQAASIGGSWLRVFSTSNPNTSVVESPTGNVSFTVEINPTGLSQNSYSGTINYYLSGTASGLVFASQNVTLNVGTGSGGTLLIGTPSSMTFVGTAGATSPPSQILQVTGQGGSAVPFTAAAQVFSPFGGTWLSLGSFSGTTPTNLTVNATLGFLTAGSYTGQIVLTPTGGGTATTVPVTFTVSATAAITATPSSLTFSWVSGNPNPAAQNILVGVSSGNAQSFSISTQVVSPLGGTWLSAAPTSGTTGNNVAVSVTPGSLTTGTYSGKVLITIPGLANSPLEVPITLNVTGPPNLTSNPSGLSFFTQPGITPANQTLTIGTSGAALSYTLEVVPNTATWLQITPTTGSTPGTVTVSANPTGLTTNVTQNASIRVTAAGAANSPFPIPVSFLVTNQQILTASPTSLTFNAVSGINPNAQTISVALSPTTPVQTFSAVAVVSTPSGSNWLTVTPANGTLPGTLNVSVNTAGLGSGTYSGTVFISGSGVANSPIQIPVTFNVSGSGGGGGGTSGTLTLSPSVLNFYTAQGGVAPSQVLNISAGSSALSYTITTNTFGSGNWLSVTPLNGITPGAVQVSVNSAGLNLGNYVGQITVTAPGATNSPQTIIVQLSVSNNPQVQATPSSLSFTYTQGGTVPFGQALNVVATAGILNFTAQAVTTNGGSWLVVAPNSGTTPGSLVVSINSSVLLSLPAGTYQGTIQLSAPGAANTPQQIPVTLTVTGAATGQFTATPSQMNFFATPGGSAPSLILNMVGPSGVNYTITPQTFSGGSWLSVSPTTGTTAGPLTQVFVQVNTSGLTTGVTYTGNITFTPTSGTPVVVPVNFTINASPQLQLNPTGLVYSFQSGGSSPSPQFSFATLSTGTATTVQLLTSTTSGGNWLSASLNSQQTPAPITVTVNPAGLPSGTYSGTVQVLAAGAINSPQNIQVTFIVGGGTGTAALSFAPGSLTFVAPPGGLAPPNQTVQVSSTGPVLSWSAQPSVSTPAGSNWLLAAPTSGATPGSLSVGVNPIGIPAGTYTGNVIFTVAGQGTQSLPVTLLVTNDPILQVSQSAVRIAFQQTGRIPAPVPVVVTTSNGSAVSFTTAASTSTGSNWLQVTPTTSSTPNAFVISVVESVVRTLPAGTYEGTVTVTAPGTVNSPRTVTVRLVVSALPLLVVNDTPLSFNAQFGGAAPAAQTVSVTSTGTPLNVTATAAVETSATWLTASINPATTPATVTVNASPAGLPTGVYNGTVTVRVTDQADTNVVIPVRLTISTSPLLTAAPAGLSFNFSGTGTAQPQTLQITSSGFAVNYTLLSSITTPAGGNWLVLSQSAGVTPGSINIGVNPVGLPDGTYFGIITISALGAANSPLTLPVTLTVSNASALQVAPERLNFTMVSGGNNPAPQSLQVTSVTPLTFGATVSTTTGGNWLNVTPTSGLTPGAVLQVSINGSLLQPGTYRGTVTLFSTQAPNSPTVEVNLVVTPPPTLSVSPSSLNFTFTAGGTAPSPQNLSVTANVPNLNFTAGASTASGGNWLSVNPTTGAPPSTLAVSVNPAGLAAGTYQGNITITPVGGATGLTVPVSIIITAPPAAQVSAVLNGASFLPGALSPGQMVSVFGTNMGPAQGVGLQIGADGKVTTQLSGVRVLFDGIPAPLTFVRADQINCVVPYLMTGRASARMQVEVNGVLSNIIEPRITDAAPGIFTSTSSGRGQGAIVNENGTINSAANPLDRGRVAIVYMTGEGQTAPPGVDGFIPQIAADLKRPVLPVSITVGGVPVPAADIFYAGSAPTFISGLMQVNFRVPASAPAGNAAIEVRVGSAASQSGVTIALR